MKKIIFIIMILSFVFAQDKFVKYTQEAESLRQIDIHIVLNVEDGVETESGVVTATYIGTQGGYVIIQKDLYNTADATDKTEITKLIGKIKKEVIKALK